MTKELYMYYKWINSNIYNSVTLSKKYCGYYTVMHLYLYLFLLFANVYYTLTGIKLKLYVMTTESMI